MELRETHSISVWYSVEDEDGIHLNGPHFPNANGESALRWSSVEAA